MKEYSVIFFCDLDQGVTDVAIVVFCYVDIIGL